MSIESYIPLETKCSWIEENSGDELFGWVVIVPGDLEGFYTISTKYKKATWNKTDEKIFWKKVPRSKLKIVS